MDQKNDRFIFNAYIEPMANKFSLTISTIILSLILMNVSAQNIESMSQMGQGLCKLDWGWSNGANMSDLGTGRPLRNWDRQSKTNPRLDDIFLTWEKQTVEIVEYFVFIGWQGWPDAIIQKDHPEGYFFPEYVESLVENKFNSVKYLSIKASEVPLNCLKFPASKTENEFYYVKLVGKSKDGKYHDIKGCILASEYQRKKEGYTAVPAGQVLSIKVPAGGRERNSLETELIAKAKKNKK